MSIESSKKVFESRGLNGFEKEVEAIKEAASVLHALIDNTAIATGNMEAGRLVSLAKTELESCVMWAVKAISRT